ncbi:MAG TPA: hypothetical protein VI357_16495 [Mycobacteriales bacterium]
MASDHVTPERSFGSVVAAGLDRSGALVLDLVDHRERTGWMVDRAVELARHGPCAFVVDPGGPAGSLIPALEARGLEVTKPSAGDVARAAGAFVDAVTERTVRHRGQVPLTAAAAGARARPLADAYAFARKGTTVCIAPLVGASLAMWGHAVKAGRVPSLYVAS